MKPQRTLFQNSKLKKIHFFSILIFALLSKLSGESIINIVQDDIPFNPNSTKINGEDGTEKYPIDISFTNGPHSSGKEEDLVGPNEEMFWFYLLGTALLVCGAGLFSGLTLGVLSLDHTTLLVLSNSGPLDQRRYAEKILPIVEQHHHVLVTLLISNAAAAETMPIFLEQIVPPTAAVAISVLLLLVFGEIIPQAICSRYGLAIGAKLNWFLKMLMFITYPLSKPIALFLDWLLGENHATFFRRAELSALIGLHGQKTDPTNEEPLSPDEVAIIKGALEMTSKTIKQAMLPLKSVFMLPEDAILDQSTLERVARKGHSRIPIYRESRMNILGMIHVKTLIQINPSDRISVKSLSVREVPRFPSSTAMYDALNEFQTGKSHLAIVTEGEIPVGIVTLEDLIEELLQEEIEDETDRHKRMNVVRALYRSASSSFGSLSSVSSTDAITSQRSTPPTRMSFNEDHPLLGRNNKETN